MSSQSARPDAVPQIAQKWADDMHRDLVAATLLDPSLICFRSVATDEPENVVRRELMQQMIGTYVPKKIPDLQGFLPNLVENTTK